MLFNSLRFVIFFAIVYAAYLALGKRFRVQNVLLLVASYVFYSFWDWRFLSLVAASTLLNYYFGQAIYNSSDDNSRNRHLAIAIIVNLAILGVFKYFNFFLAGFSDLLTVFGLRSLLPTFNIILPLGISFYTFQVMSYPIDIRRSVIKPTSDLTTFALFVSFFPLMISGPIERARNMLPQFSGPRQMSLDKFYKGSWLFFFGLFKKIVIADNLAKITVPIFGRGDISSGADVLVAMYAFALQVYADFSGYSDMARGISMMMGFEVMVNFRTPFFASTIPDLWQRWHISLTTWIKEYLYYPLALWEFRGRQIMPWLVVVITWVIMGLWHGAYWKFVAWGLYHGFIIVGYSRARPYIALLKPRNGPARGLFTIGETVIIFNIFVVGLLFFACPSVGTVWASLKSIFCNAQAALTLNKDILAVLPYCILPVAIIEFIQFRTNDEFALFKWPPLARGLVYFILLYLLTFFGDLHAQKYYYFQF
jgi:alginate O-acetyltransferase complex protein AlgI